MKKDSLSSILAQAGHFIDDATGAITPPIHPSTSFARDDDYELIGSYSYSRNRNPTYDQVEHRASLEGPMSKVPANLLRFSVGIETVEDLILDIERGLEGI